ncbi:MAG TPA: glycosyltransferase 87 family protein [Gemmatimonadales bacterium]|jgi:hypothetical protein|nr:glycosyltransferase 87 family protein [Gemmatimonadales bacterium]
MERIAQRIVAAFIIGLSIAWVIWSINGFSLSDSQAYRAAAERLLAGQDLYVQAETQDEAFRYAPWFAAAWVPLNALPHLLGDALWAAALFAASVAAVVPLARQERLAARLLALLGGAMLLWTAARGNVHPLVLVALIHGIDRRSGPLWVAAAASLKAVPILFVLIYVARRDWTKVALTVALTAALVLPMPLFGWELGSVDAGDSLSVYSLFGPVVWAAAAGLFALLAVAAALLRPRIVAPATGLAAIAALPRLLIYDLTYLLVGANEGRLTRPGGPRGWRRDSVRREWLGQKVKPG